MTHSLLLPPAVDTQPIFFFSTNIYCPFFILSHINLTEILISLPFIVLAILSFSKYLDLVITSLTYLYLLLYFTSLTLPVSVHLFPFLLISLFLLIIIFSKFVSSIFIFFINPINSYYFIVPLPFFVHYSFHFFFTFSFQ